MHASALLVGCPPGEAYGFGSRLAITYRCSNTKCDHAFLAYFTPSPDLTRAPGGLPVFTHSYSVPSKKQAPAVPARVATLSPRFTAVLAEAVDAEGRGLFEVSGPGYRKALEILVKDFVLTKHGDEEERIRKMPLRDCIRTFLDDSRLEKRAAKAAYLGNDQTHYYIRHTHHDLDDLKTLMKMTVDSIDMILLDEAYGESLPD